jgi:phosphotransferase system  glucose/maltose/N-acetylglucosamine-specific IIC component
VKAQSPSVFKPVRRSLIEGLLVTAAGAFAVWPFAEIGVRAGLSWATFGLFAAVAFGAIMGYTIKDSL